MGSGPVGCALDCALSERTDARRRLAMKLQLPGLGTAETVWLWLSFQRYAFLLSLLALAPLLGLTVFGILAWWAWALAALVALCVTLGVAAPAFAQDTAKLEDALVAAQDDFDMIELDAADEVCAKIDGEIVRWLTAGSQHEEAAEDEGSRES